MKYSILLACLVGIVGAARADFKNPVFIDDDGKCWDNNQKRVKPCPDVVDGETGQVGPEEVYQAYRQNAKYPNNDPMPPANIADLLCPSGWKESDYYLISGNREHEQFGGKSVEVCTENGLIRIKK